jgi:hypothetical protein
MNVVNVVNVVNFVNSECVPGPWDPGMPPGVPKVFQILRDPRHHKSATFFVAAGMDEMCAHIFLLGMRCPAPRPGSSTRRLQHRGATQVVDLHSSGWLQHRGATQVVDLHSSGWLQHRGATQVVEIQFSGEGCCTRSRKEEAWRMRFPRHRDRH